MAESAEICIRDFGEAEKWLGKVRDVISLLLAEAVSVKTFRGRWRGITNRSQQILDITTTITNASCSDQSTLLRDLLPTIVNTLEEARLLANKCTELNYEGKLLMQSNLDALTTKLLLYHQNLEFILRTVSFKEMAPVAGSYINEFYSPAKREAVTLHVRNLFARLKIGNTELKKKALESLIDCIKCDDKNAILTVEEGDIPYLIHLLDASMPVIREKAVETVSILTQVDACRDCLTTENIHAPLIRLLETGTPVAKEKAAEALIVLTRSQETALSVAARGGIPALVEICKSGTPAMQTMAAGSLRNLSIVDKIRRCLLDGSAIPVLVKLVSRGTDLSQEYATEALQHLASGEDRLRLVIARHNGLQSLLIYLHHSTTTRAQELAIRALRNLSAVSANAKALVSAGYLSELAKLLDSGTSTVQRLAVSAICYLSISLDVRKEMGEAGCIPPLARMLEAKSNIEKEAAAQALSTLLLNDSNRREFYKDERGIPRLVQLLDPHEQSIAKRFPMSALLALSRSSHCRKRILSAGARQHLEKLAEMEIAGD
eukprot:c23007_g1_i1 orf=1-1638(-)